MFEKQLLLDYSSSRSLFLVDQSMSSFESKECGNCSGQFECKPENIAECECSEVKLSEEAKKKLAEDFKDCVCSGCLRSIARQFENDKYKS